MTTTKRPTMSATCATLLGLALVGIAATLPSTLAIAQTQAPGVAPFVYAPPPPYFELPPAAPATLTWTRDPGRFGVSLETQTLWPQDGAARRLAGKDTSTGGGLSVQWDALRLERLATVSLDLSWLSSQTTTSQDFSGLEAKQKLNLLSLAIAARHHLRPWLAPYVRIAGGIGWDNASVNGAIANLHDTRVFGQGSLGGGLFFQSPRLRLWNSPSALNVGLMAHLEGGYVLGSSTEHVLESAPSTASSTPIPTSSVPLGKVGHSAPYLRLSGGIAF